MSQSKAVGPFLIADFQTRGSSEDGSRMSFESVSL